MIVPLTLFTQLAASCAPAVHVDTLAAVAGAESGFDAHAVHVNGADRRTASLATREEAILRATELIVGEGRSVDLGLMQVNSANLAPLELSIADAFDPCRSLAAGARLLADGYTAALAGGADPQQALLAALSRYNTGDPTRGIADGYVARVQAAAEQVVPAIRLGDGGTSPSERAGQGRAPDKLPPAGPPSWDVYGQARAARERRLATMVASPGPAPPGAPAPATAAPLTPAAPVLLRATSGGLAPAR